MGYILNDDQKSIVKLAHDFCEKEIKPYAAQWDREGIFPLESYKKAMEIGFHCLEIPEEFGGGNVVRRLSGGGTIYTDQGGWEFTFISRNNAGQISFAEYIEPVVSALCKLGVDAGFNGRNDLVIGGKKISGNAQYMIGDYTLHHGSLLFDTNIENMVRSTTVDDYKIISKGIKSVRERVTNIREHLPYDMDVLEFRRFMVVCQVQ